MYRYKFVWTIGPTVLTIASFAISMTVVSKYSHIDLSASKDAITTHSTPSPSSQASQSQLS
ncbi:hypothetical protein FRC08_006811 [Ceratobasidium sp. 394]|nr:hypothetical protein FRC08_006811 [Ceratobasidium sp. 394]KAG9083892.1 hypothetical protein FS749_005652 [Ceratobasidium sp. UAMH 11750]